MPLTTCVVLPLLLGLPPGPPRTAGRQAQPGGPPAAARISAIQFQRTMCLGTCPAYTVTLRRDGTATYVGRAHAPRLGEYRARVHPWVFGQLARLVVRAGFFSMRKRYRAQVTCQPSQILRVRVGGRWHQVFEYGNAGPVTLWGLQQAVDGVASQLRWQRPGRSATPPVTAEQFARAVGTNIARLRRRARLPALTVAPGASAWAAADARRLFRPLRRGTLTRQIQGALQARLTSCGHRRARDAVNALARSAASPLRHRAYRRMGIGAAWDADAGAWCVVVVLGK